MKTYKDLKNTEIAKKCYVSEATVSKVLKLYETNRRGLLDKLQPRLQLPQSLVKEVRTSIDEDVRNGKIMLRSFSS